METLKQTLLEEESEKIVGTQEEEEAPSPLEGLTDGFLK